MARDTLVLRWLGAAGIELRCSGVSVLIDPYLSRLQLHQLLAASSLRKVPPLISLVSHADAVVVTHPHFDHLMDVPHICRKLNSVAYGSYNTCSILSSMGVGTGQIREVVPGDRFCVGPFDIEVLPSSHIFFPPFRGARVGEFKAPLTPLQFRMDHMYSYHISIGSVSVMTDQGTFSSRSADILFARSTLGPRVLRRMIELARPRAVVPIHWDNFLRPLRIEGVLTVPRWRLPFSRFDPKGAARAAARTSVRPRCLVLQPFTFYCPEEILG